MPRYALWCEVGGPGLCGTAPQPGCRTLDNLLSAALDQAVQETPRLQACSRLDAGVAAEQFVVHFDLHRELAPEALLKRLVPRLIPELGLRALAQVAPDWHARYHARRKIYAYRLLVRPSRCPLTRQCWWLPQLKYPEQLSQLAALLPGYRDLSGFAALRHDPSDCRDPRRHYHRIGWDGAPYKGGTLWTCTLEGEGFLYRQVRGLVGAMVAVANDPSGRMRARFVDQLEQGRKALQRAGDCAPPDGLTLERVVYEPEPAWVDGCGQAHHYPA